MLEAFTKKNTLLNSREKVKQGKFATSLRNINKQDLPDISTLVFLGKGDLLVDNGYARELFDEGNIMILELSHGGHMAHEIESKRVLKKMVEFGGLVA